MFSWPRWQALELSRQSRKAVTIAGVITEVDPEQQDNEGALHQIFTVQVKEIIDEARETALSEGDLIYVAVRHSDPSGLREPIAGITAGQAVELRGAYIAPEDAYEVPGRDRLGVIHFTHRPLGWVEYQGRRYQ